MDDVDEERGEEDMSGGHDMGWKDDNLTLHGREDGEHERVRHREHENEADEPAREGREHREVNAVQQALDHARAGESALVHQAPDRRESSP